jgi:hypothetical protein
VVGKPFEGFRDADAEGAEALDVPLERHFRTVVPPNGKLLGRFVTGESIANVC